MTTVFFFSRGLNPVRVYHLMLSLFLLGRGNTTYVHADLFFLVRVPICSCDGATSYYHKSIGGYHAAKLRRYQELIDFHIANNNIQVLNMLNTTYFILPNERGEQQVQMNPFASVMGSFWQNPHKADAAKGATDDILQRALREATGGAGARFSEMCGMYQCQPFFHMTPVVMWLSWKNSEQLSPHFWRFLAAHFSGTQTSVDRYPLRR